MNNNNKQILLSIFIIIVLTLLCFKLYSDDKKLNCQKCDIEFKSNTVLDLGNKNYNIPIELLYNELNNNKCLITWDKVQGYMLN